ncbi:MAG: hypothetical protein ACK4V4_01120 [Sphingobacteriales bacterium]|jgi:uncharacterized protein involved in exopolysaccharide biosynthesis
MLTALITEIAEKKWRIILFVGIITSMTIALSLIFPKEYLAEASLLPANSRMMDKQRLYGENIQELYSAYGSGEDLDRVFAAMQSVTVLQFVVDNLDLVTHYKFRGKKNSKLKAREYLEDQMRLVRTEYGELRLHVWDRDTIMASRISNLLIQRTQSVFDDMFQLYYDRSISNLKKELADSSTKKRTADESAFIKSRISEYEVTRLNPPPSFIVMEPPVVSAVPDKPDFLLNITAALLISIFVSISYFGVRIALRTA